MTEKEFINELKKINIDVSSEKLDKLKILLEELKEYNKKTNLTRIIESNDVYLKHYFDSLTIAKVINLNKYKSLIDVGTGAGFPGLVLAIFYPNLKVTVLDSNIKKIEWLNYISEKLSLDIEIIHDRVENYSKQNLNKFEIVTCRAVANLRVLTEISMPLVKINGYFIPLKATIEQELKEAMVTIELFQGEIEEINCFNLYGNTGVRNIIKIKKKKGTTLDKIRSYDKIIKKALKK